MAIEQQRRVLPGAAWAALPVLLGLLVCGCPSPSAGPTSQRGGEALEAMKTAYRKADSYTDAATLHVKAKDLKLGEEKHEEIPVAVSLERPNKLRVDAFGANVVCDGKQFYGIVADPAMSDQVLFHQAPPDLTIKQVYSDPVLDQMLSDGTGIRLPQLELLLGDSPLQAVFGTGYEAKRLADEKLPDEDKPCQRVETTSESGKFVAWIDGETHVLRRLEMPDGPFRKRYDPDGKYEFHLWIDFNGAKLASQIDADAFKFEAPSSAMLLKWFVAPPPGVRNVPHELLGKQPDEFKFVDLDGHAVDLASLSGKVVVLDFWFLNCPYCFQAFPYQQKVYDQYKDNPRVQILAVDTDESSLPDKSLLSAFAQAKLSLPIVRDPGRTAGAFKLQYFPTTVLLGPDGNVQDYKVGVDPDIVDTLPKKIDALLAGTDLAGEVLAKYEQVRDQFQRHKAEGLEGTTQQIELPRAKIAEHSEPSTLKLSKLWTSAGLKNPGNLLVLDEGAGPRIFVLDGWSKVVELDATGKTVTTHDIELPKEATITQLRTAVDGQGQRYFAGFDILKQQVFVFDADWKQLLAFPEGGHAGLFDVQLADLDGDGQIEINLGYAGSVGVQNVSLAGKRNWSFRGLDNVISLAAMEPDADGHRQLWCANERPAIAVLSYDGKPQPDIAVPDRGVDVLVTAHLAGIDELQVAALVYPKPSELLAIGLDLKGHELWNYSLPSGVRNTPCNVLIAGRVLADGPAQWLLNGPDGSVHILAADGTLIDKFNYGAELTGIGTVQIDGRPALLLAAGAELTAWSVESGTSAENPAPEKSTAAVDISLPADDKPMDEKPTDAKASNEKPSDEKPADEDSDSEDTPSGA